MGSQAFDWRTLAASDDELSKHLPEGELYQADSDVGSWKRGIVAAYFKEDYLNRAKGASAERD